MYTREIDASFYAGMEELRCILPHLRLSGFKSLLNVLKSQNLITSENTGYGHQFRITRPGATALKKALPALARGEEVWNGKWTALLFRQSPDADKEFRYLRHLLVSYQSLALNRGVYLYPDRFPEQVIKEVEQRYAGSVTMLLIEKWLTDDERQIALSQFGLSDLLLSYSGISKEIDRLISRKKVISELNQGEKSTISSLFDRLYQNVLEDMGILRYYFPQVESGEQLLARFRTLLSN